MNGNYAQRQPIVYLRSLERRAQFSSFAVALIVWQIELFNCSIRFLIQFMFAKRSDRVGKNLLQFNYFRILPLAICDQNLLRKYINLQLNNAFLFNLDINILTDSSV